MTDHLDDRTYDLLFGIRRSVRYHNHRRQFFERWNSLTATVAAVFGSSAALAWLTGAPEGWGWVPAVAAAIVGALGAVDLAVGTARRAYTHGDLARCFIHLEQMFSHGGNLDDQTFKVVTQKRLEIEASEPPILRLLDVLCHFELLRALGEAIEHPKIPRRRRILAHWLSQAYYARSLYPSHDANS